MPCALCWYVLIVIIYIESVSDIFEQAAARRNVLSQHGGWHGLSVAAYGLGLLCMCTRTLALSRFAVSLVAGLVVPLDIVGVSAVLSGCVYIALILRHCTWLHILVNVWCRT